MLYPKFGMRFKWGNRAIKQIVIKLIDNSFMDIFNFRMGETCNRRVNYSQL